MQARHEALPDFSAFASGISWFFKGTAGHAEQAGVSL
jgi:hypothetical protein